MSRTHRTELGRLAWPIAALLLITSRVHAAQQPDANAIWAPAAQIHEFKNQFVVAVRQLAEAVSGTYGDEGPRILERIGALEDIQRQWDEAITSYEARLASARGSAEAHVALGTVYLDRSRGNDALRELAEARRLDPRRPDALTMASLAHGFLDQPAKAADALRQAAAMGPANAVILYGFALQSTRSGNVEGARSAMESFVHAAASNQARAPGSTFERAGLLRQAAGVAPIFPPDLYREGFRRLQVGEYARAIVDLRSAAARDPLLRQPELASAAAAGAALRRGDLHAALTLFESSVASTPDRSEPHRMLGVAYAVDEQFDRSAEQLTLAIRLAPDDERARIALADSLTDAGRAEDAFRTLSETARLFPGSGQARYRLGQSLQNSSQLARAAGEFEAAASLHPLVGLDRLYELIGSLYASQADLDRAADAYVRRIDVNPNNADAHRRLGEIRFIQGRDEEALGEFTAALLVDPKQAGALSGAGQVHARNGRFAEAAAAARDAIALEPRLKDAHFTLGTSLLRLGRTDEGRKELDLFRQLEAEALESTRRQAEFEALTHEVDRRLATGDYAGTLAPLKDALTLEPGAARLQRDLGVALLKTGRRDDAVAALEQALRLGDDAAAHRALAEAYAAAGRDADSRAQTALATRAADQAKAARLRRLTAR